MQFSRKLIKICWSWIKSPDKNTIELQFSFMKASIGNYPKMICSCVCTKVQEIFLQGIVYLMLPDSFSYLVRVRTTLHKLVWLLRSSLANVSPALPQAKSFSFLKLLLILYLLSNAIQG